MESVSVWRSSHRQKNSSQAFCCPRKERIGSIYIAEILRLCGPELNREPPASILRYPQLQLADPRDLCPVVIPRPVALPAHRPLALLGAQGFRHLRFAHLTQRRPHQPPRKLLVSPERF